MIRYRFVCFLVAIVVAALFQGTLAQAQVIQALFSDISALNPQAGLVQGSDGNFYGTTYHGGASGNGTVFKMTPGGALTTLVSFTGSNGQYPQAGLVQGSDGNFYGTTYFGGANGVGTVFKVSAGGALTTLVSFNYSNGCNPFAGLVQGSDGNFYGTTRSGGANGYGTVFKVSAEGTLTMLASFNSTNGADPHAGLVQGSDGNFYGTTYQGGTNNQGTVFKVSLGGTLTTLYSFDGSIGAHPCCTPLFRADGNLYGTANQMLIWRITPASAPTVATGVASGIGATAATVSGTVTPNSGNTSVLFEYGISTAYGSNAAAVPGTVLATSTTTAVSASLSGLSPHTLYHYRVDATDSAGTSYGADATFTTANTQPTAGASTASINTGNTATITLPFATTDADGDSVTVQSISASVGAPFTLGTVTGNSVSVTGSLNTAGIGTITFTVTDGFGGTANGTVSVTVTDNISPTFTSAPADTTVEAAPGSTGVVVNYTAATATDNVGVTSLTANYPSGSTFPIGQTLVQYTASDAAGNTTRASFTVTVLSGDAATNSLGAKGATVLGAGIPAGAVWSSFGAPCATAGGDAFVAAALQTGKVIGKDIVMIDGATGNVGALVQAGTAVPGLTGLTISSFTDPLAVSADDGTETVVYLATIAGKGVSLPNNKALITNIVSGGAITQSNVLLRSGVAIGQDMVKVASFNSVGLGQDGSVWALVTLVPGVGGVTTANNLVLLSWGLGSTTFASVLHKGQLVTFGDGKNHMVSAIATLAAAGSSPGQGRWEGAGELIFRVSFTDGLSAILTAGSDGSLAEVVRKGDTVTLLNPAGTEEAAGAEWANFGLPALDSGGGVTFEATLGANIGGVTSANAGGIFRQESYSSDWTALARIGDSTGQPNGSKFSSFNDPVSNGAGTVAFLATEQAGVAKTAALWSSSWTGSGQSPTRALSRIAGVGQSAPESGGCVFSGFSSVALPEWQNAGPLVVATLKIAPKGATASNNRGLWGVDFNGNLRLLLRTGYPLPGAAAGSPLVKTFTVLQAVIGSNGQPRACDGERGVYCNVTFSNGATAAVKVSVP